MMVDLVGPFRVPDAWSVLVVATALIRSFRPIWRAASAEGSAWMRTAYLAEPMIETCATPSMVEIWLASRVREYWSTLEIGRLLDHRVIRKIGWAEGSFLRKLGGAGIALGRRRCTLEIAACTSWAAASILRSRRNCRVMPV